MGDTADIIAAIATGAGAGAVGIVRVSGAGSHDLVRRLCPGLRRAPADRRLVRCLVVHPATGRPLDDVLVAFFAAGASYTGEEAAELQGHGGRVVLGGVLEACLAAGARPARPGEFTRRALAAGRLDLAQAEAVAVLADAATEGAVDLALDALSGRPSSEVARLSDRVLDLLAECTASLDFAEEDGVVVDLAPVRDGIEAAAEEVRGWLDAARAARPCLSGFRIALVGRPNAGKSSLFNALLGRPRAIVHDEPGTTRDVVGEPVVLAGAPCVLLDTAGLRLAAGPVEAEGVERARRAAADADCVVLVVDGSGQGADEVPAAARAEGLRVDVVAWHKADRWESGDSPLFSPGKTGGCPHFPTSAVDGRGIEELRAFLAARAAVAMRAGATGSRAIAGERQVEAAAAAREHLRRASAGLGGGAPLEAVAADLREAAGHLSEITGSRVDEAVLDRVFARFCVGK